MKTIFLLSILFLFGNCEANLKLPFPKNTEVVVLVTGCFWCDSISVKELIMVNNWNSLAENYAYIPFDTIIGKRKLITNTRLERDGEIVAYGSLDKKGRPTGWWGIKSNSNTYFICCAGFFKKGSKQKNWWALDGYNVIYKKNKAPLVIHRALGR